MKISSIIGAGPNRGWNLVRIAVAVVLLVAAGLKTHQLATEPTFGHSILESRWFLMATVEFELFFGLWLLSGLLPKQTRMAAIGCFAVFTCVSLYKAVSGEASCGCFGRVHVNPWITTSLDLAILASLLKWRPSPAHILTFPRVAIIATLWLIVGLPAGLAMATYTDTTLSDAGEIIGDGKIVLLEPEKWIGKRFPLLPFIEDSSGQLRTTERSLRERLIEGQWLVVLYHRDCPECQETIPKYEKLARCSVADSTVPRVALIEVPLHGRSSAAVFAGEMPCALGGLRTENDWFVETPLEFCLQDGTVKSYQARRRNSKSAGVARMAMPL